MNVQISLSYDFIETQQHILQTNWYVVVDTGQVRLLRYDSTTKRAKQSTEEGYLSYSLKSQCDN